MTSRPPRITAGPWTLYRLGAGDGTRLYIGISRRPGGRMADHERNAEWWREVRSLTFETFPTWEEAWEAEGRAIEAENPRHNIARRSRPRGYYRKGEPIPGPDVLNRSRTQAR